MATLLQINSFCIGTPELEQRFRAARLKAAWDIFNESELTENHASRLAWANSVIAGYIPSTNAEYLRFLSNPTIQSKGVGSADDEIQFAVNSLINTFAA